jgi:hypothetical protein
VPEIAAAVWGGLIGIVLQDQMDSDFDGAAAIDALARMVLGEGPWSTVQKTSPAAFRSGASASAR